MEDATVLQEYKDSVKTKAEELLVKGFPEKIVKLNELLETPRFSTRKLSDVHQDLNVPVPDPIRLDHSEDAPAAKKLKLDQNGEETSSGTKVMVLPTKPVPCCNKKFCKLIHIVKPYIEQLLEDSNLLKMWISFLIPKIEDGNNFGVSIQKAMLSEIQSVESKAAAFLDQISRYYISRVRIVSKAARYPHIDHCRRAIQELDENEYVSLRLVTRKVRNHYCSLHDLLIKNLEKIKQPRSSNAQFLY
ncbi:proteasome activator complex subunit 3-like isoform X2 [Temnothorax americanus]|uniref:proteasome activator complex subunit 3-like isoform X2 n=1 Tax=Temnothorax americanus TaxID=1964332 RepID=UPI0040687D86